MSYNRVSRACFVFSGALTCAKHDESLDSGTRRQKGRISLVAMKAAPSVLQELQKHQGDHAALLPATADDTWLADVQQQVRIADTIDTDS
jgi:hypothetical protein